MGVFNTFEVHADELVIWYPITVAAYLLLRTAQLYIVESRVVMRCSDNVVSLLTLCVLYLLPINMVWWLVCCLDGF